MAHTVIELEVKLRGVEPTIWRTVEVPGSSTLEDVHLVLQLAMGWQNCHLHEYAIGASRYGMVDGTDAPRELLDERRFRLQDVVKQGDAFVYEYDFGDGWQHDVTVTKVAKVSKVPKPRCPAGARACPPEDCGGPHGYDELLAALADPRHEQHAERLAWRGPFDPEAFVLPNGGRDLGAAIEELKALAEDDEPTGMTGAADVAFPDLPRALVEGVLALSPMQRASLVALVSGSLAAELVEVQDIMTQLTTAMRTRGHGPSRAPRSSSRKRT